MKRLYFLIPSVTSAKQIVDELLLARVDERHLHILSNNEDTLHREHLPEATLLEKSDLLPAAERGIAIGGATGLLASLVALTSVSGGLGIDNGAVVLLMSLAGALFGAWISGMIGISLHNSRLRRYEAAIEHGSLLLMVDVPSSRVDEVNSLVAMHHPEILNQGMEPTMPAFP